MATNFRSNEEISALGEAFATNPHDVYETLAEMSHEALSVLAMQLLSRSAVPLTGPSSSSRVGATAMAMRRQRLALNYSLASQSISMLTMSQSSRSMPAPWGGKRVAARVYTQQHPHGASPQESPGSPRRTSSTLEQMESLLDAPVVTVSPQWSDNPFSTTSFLDDADAVRRMSTHELEQSLHDCGFAMFEERSIPLQQIFFYQDYICNQFMDGKFLTDTISQLIQGKVTPEMLPVMDCLRFNNRWYGMGNRRLSCYHYVYRNEPNRRIPVRAFVIPQGQQLFPQGDGLTVKLGGGHVLDGRIRFTMKHCTMWDANTLQM